MFVPFLELIKSRGQNVEYMWYAPKAVFLFVAWLGQSACSSALRRSSPRGELAQALSGLGLCGGVKNDSFLSQPESCIHLVP